jgi:hypothetical protein
MGILVTRSECMMNDLIDEERTLVMRYRIGAC